MLLELFFFFYKLLYCHIQNLILSKLMLHILQHLQQVGTNCPNGILDFLVYRTKKTNKQKTHKIFSLQEVLQINIKTQRK